MFVLICLFVCGLVIPCRGQDTHGQLSCGGPNGEIEWSDEEYFANYGDITAFEVWHGMVIDGIRFTYGNQPTPVRGSDQGGELFSYTLGPGEEIMGARMSVGREGVGNDDVLCKLKIYIKQPDGVIFSILFGDCDKDEDECGEYIPNKALQYSTGFYKDYVDYLTLVFSNI